MQIFSRKRLERSVGSHGGRLLWEVACGCFSAPDPLVLEAGALCLPRLCLHPGRHELGCPQQRITQDGHMAARFRRRSRCRAEVTPGPEAERPGPGLAPPLLLQL